MTTEPAPPSPDLPSSPGDGSTPAAGVDAAGAGPAHESGRASLIEYPSAFPIKVMGAQDPDFEPAVLAIVREHDPGFDAATVERRPSSGGRYMGLTVTVTATSREQLDALYRALTACPKVKVVL